MLSSCFDDFQLVLWTTAFSHFRYYLFFLALWEYSFGASKAKQIVWGRLKAKSWCQPFSASIFGCLPTYLECDPPTSCLFGALHNWAQELIIAVRPLKYAIGPDVACLPAHGACDNKFGSCSDGSLHLEGAWSKFWLILGRWHTCSATERGEIWRTSQGSICAKLELQRQFGGSCF